MEVYLFRHKRVPVTFIKLLRKDWLAEHIGFRTHLFLTLGRALTRDTYKSGKLRVIRNFLEKNNLFKDFYHEPGMWMNDWNYESLFSTDKLDTLREQTEWILGEALENDAFLLNQTLPWNRGTILRDMNGEWVGSVRPHAHLERIEAQRNYYRKNGIKPAKPSPLITVQRLEEPEDEHEEFIKKDQRKNLNPFQRVFGK